MAPLSRPEAKFYESGDDPVTGRVSYFFVFVFVFSAGGGGSG